MPSILEKLQERFSDFCGRPLHRGVYFNLLALPVPTAHRGCHSRFSYNDDVETSHPDFAATAETYQPKPKIPDSALSPNGRAASSDSPAESGFKNFLFTHKGDLTLAFSALVYVVAWAALRFTPWRTAAEMVVAIAEAALIGGLCDYIALRMIFERKWYLPGSGVLPRNRVKLINGIASTIEKSTRATPPLCRRRQSAAATEKASIRPHIGSSQAKPTRGARLGWRLSPAKARPVSIISLASDRRCACFSVPASLWCSRPRLGSARPG